MPEHCQNREPCVICALNNVFACARTGKKNLEKIGHSQYTLLHSNNVHEIISAEIKMNILKAPAFISASVPSSDEKQVDEVHMGNFVGF